MKINFYLNIINFQTSAALMGVSKSNEWTINYNLSFSLDSFMIETVLNFFKLYMIRQELLAGGEKFFAKTFGNEDLIRFFKHFK